jgi:hypothetical protein
LANEYLNNKIFETVIAKFQRSKQDKTRYEMIIDDLQESQRRRIGKEPNRLLNAKECEYKQTIKEFVNSQDQLAAAFYTLSENIVRYAKFHLIDEQDAVQEGVRICFEKIDRFDPVKGKAFNYMTTCILNHMRQLYRTSRNYNELKRKYLIFMENLVCNELKTKKNIGRNKNYNI